MNPEHERIEKLVKSLLEIISLTNPKGCITKEINKIAREAIATDYTGFKDEK